MPTIEIDTDVYDVLKALAVPFEDTPNSVLRRELKLDTPPKSKTARGGPTRTQRATVGSILPEREYERPILRALIEAGGTASARDVTDRVGELLNTQLTETDQQMNRSGEVRWRNRAAFARLRLVERGLLVSGSRRGVWEISQAGRAALASTSQ